MTRRFDFVRVDGTEKARGEGRLLLAAVDGAQVPGGRLQVRLGPKKVGGQYARIDLELGNSPQRFIEALFNDGPYPGQNWIEIYDLDLPAGLDYQDGSELALAPYLEPLAQAIPSGGHLMIEYERELWGTTQRGLLAGIPPLATPLGGLLFKVGCGDSFKDWYFPEGGQEGGRKLQGNKAAGPKQARRMASQLAAQLRSFLGRPAQGDSKIDARARQDAARILEVLGARGA